MNVKYLLYIGKPQKLDNIEFQFYSSESGYQLAFHSTPIANMQIVPLEKQSRLSRQEQSWLTQCKLLVNTRAIKENSQQYIELLNEFLTIAETTLREKMEKKANQSPKVTNGKET